ncbi:MAG: hypothetical protein JW912_02700, partial [Sedimentisphaerales bacterium]|nr:hypothetical protein [Sedimentisphaerales bacterium]
MKNKSCKKYRSFITGMILCVVLAAAWTHHSYAALEDNLAKIFSGNNASEKSTAVIDSVCDMIQKGQFQEAREVIDNSSELNSPRLDQLRWLLERYDRIMQNRTGLNKEGYVKQLDELDELRLGPRAKDPNSPAEIAKENMFFDEPV